jgi:hypothetical protein
MTGVVSYEATADDPVGTFVVHPDAPPGTSIMDESCPVVRTGDTFAVRAVPNGPRELGALRSEFVHGWQQNWWSAERLSLTPNVEVAHLLGSRLLWVDRELAASVASLASTVPADTVLVPEDLPWPHGFVLFDLAGQMAVLQWFSDGDGVVLRGARLFDFDAGLTESDLLVARPQMARLLDQMREEPSLTHALRLSGSMWAPTGERPWQFGAQVGDDTALGHVAVALWRLMESDQIVETQQVQRSKKAGRKRRRRDDAVTVVRFRGRSVVSNGPGVGGRLTVRFPVRPYGRWQRCGPGGSERRWVVVQGHWRGPEDGPVKVSDTVWLLDESKGVGDASP